IGSLAGQQLMQRHASGTKMLVDGATKTQDGVVYPRQSLCQLLLIVTSTFGNGEMPGNGQQFLQGLQQQLAEALTGVNYAVLGIGSTVYEHFCAAGMTLHKLLARKGANPLVPLHKADAVKGQAATFQEWLGLVSRLIGVDETSAQAQALPRLQITYLSDAAIALPTLVGTAVPLLANQELLKAVVPGSRSTRYLLFDISDTTLAYETGDHVRVYPHNSAALVQRLCDRLNLVPDAAFTAQYVLPNGQIADTPPPIAGPTTVRQAFTEMLDLVLQAPFIELLTALQSAATAVEESIRLATWLEVLALPPNHADSAALRQTLTDNFMTVVDLLEAFPSAQIGLDVLLEHLPRLKPRLYSISSCPQFQPGRLQITVGVLQVQTDAGKTRPGVCSNYLAGLQPGDTVRIDPHSSDFCPPADPTAPLLMVGPGTGLSPLLAFLQHREYLQRQGAALGNATLYFGCRDHNDFLYETQLKAWLASGVLTDLQVAFSRLNESKVYVQTLIRQRAAEVWQQLSHPQCHYYVCGDARMADNVFDTFVQIAKTEGGLSHLDAIAFFDQMKQEGRFATDVWGVTLNFNTAIKQVEQDNYRRAEKWLTTL
ncbi:MAG: sulfite reductase flavoprotein subunit alpha, partial [Cyanobacteria bacterium J06638_6]